MKHFWYYLSIVFLFFSCNSDSKKVKVVDFISLHVFDYYWYVFNIADIAIVSGGLSVLMYSAKDSFKTSK